MEALIDATGRKIVNNPSFSRALLRKLYDNLEALSEGSVVEFPKELMEKRKLDNNDIDKIVIVDKSMTA